MDVRVRVKEIAFTDNCCRKMGAVWPIWEQQDGADRPLKGVRLQATGQWGILIGMLAPTTCHFHTERGYHELTPILNIQMWLCDHIQIIIIVLYSVKLS